MESVAGGYHGEVHCIIGCMYNIVILRNIL